MFSELLKFWNWQFQHFTEAWLFCCHVGAPLSVSAGSWRFSAGIFFAFTVWFSIPVNSYPPNHMVRSGPQHLQGHGALFDLILLCYIWRQISLSPIFIHAMLCYSNKLCQLVESKLERNTVKEEHQQNEKCLCDSWALGIQSSLIPP